MSRPLLAALAVATLGAIAPATAHADDIGVWAGETLNVDLRKPGQKYGAALWFELTERKWGANWRNMIRPGVGFVAKVGRSDLSVWGGYAMEAAYTDGVTENPWKIEHRIYEMFQAESKLSKENPIRLTERLRLEQRFLEGSEDVQLRLRVYARGLFPIGKGGWGISVYDEAFFKLNEIDVASAGFDQNRAFIGPYFQSDKGVRTELGYFNLLVDKKDVGLVDSHIALVNLTVSLKAFQPEKKKGKSALLDNPTAETVPGLASL